jgi:hypothetical protein
MASIQKPQWLQPWRNSWGRLEEHTTENKKFIAKTKNKKAKRNSSSSEEEDSSFEEDVSKKEKKGRRNRDKPSYNSMSFNYN